MKRISVCLIFVLLSSQVTSAILEEVVVTAQKREQSAQDVSISISAFSSNQLKALGVNSNRDLALFTPGVEINEEYGNATTFTIRGVNTNDFYATTSPTAAVYVDGVYKASNINSGSQIFDIERIEILKGPQGTLYGRNVTGGAVSIISKQPTDDWDGYVEATYGTFDTKVVEGAIGGPVSDMVKFRISGQWTESDGKFDNVQFSGSPDPFNHGVTPDPSIPDGLLLPVKSEVGSTDMAAVRGQLLIEPNDEISITLRGHFSSDTGSNHPTWSTGVLGPNCGIVLDASGANVIGGTFNPSQCVTAQGFSDPDPFDENISNNYTPDRDTEIYGASIDLEWETALGKVVSISAYEGFNRYGGIDSDSGPVANVDALYNTAHHSWTQELRLENSVLDDRIFFVLGAYYAYDELKNDDDRAFLEATIGTGTPGQIELFNRIDQETDHISVFGQLEYALSDTWKLIAGLRYSDEDKEIFHEDSLTFSGFGPPLVVSSSEAPGAINKRTSKDLSYRFGIEWSPKEEMLLFFNHSRGVKSGGWGGAPIFAQSAFVQFGEEVLKSYEFGWKWDISENLRFNGAAFYYDYEKPQSLVGVDTGGGILTYTLMNLEEAEQLGFEFELGWSPIQGLELLANASFLDSEISQPGDPLLDGRELAYSADESFAFIGRYEWPAGDSLIMSMQANVSYTGDHYPDVFNVFFEEQDFVTVGARLSVGSTDGKWEASVWGKNLTDDIHIINSYNLAQSARGGFLSDPLSAGVTLSYNFF